MNIPIYVAKADEQSFMGMIYGYSGYGKTTIAGTAFLRPDLFGKTLVVDVEGGLSAIAHHGNVLTAEVNDAYELNALGRALALPDDNAKKPEALIGVQTIIIDSLTELQNRHRSKVTAEQTRKSSKRSDPYMAEQQDYLYTLNAIQSAVGILMSLRMNLIILAQQKDTRQGGFDTHAPGLSPKMGEITFARMSYIWAATVKADAKGEMHYGLQVLPDAHFATKVRSPRFVDALENCDQVDNGILAIPDRDFPTLPFLYELYLESHGEKS